MTGSHDAGNFRFLLLEASPGTLAMVGQAWTAGEALSAVLAPDLGVADLVSREKVQLVVVDFCRSPREGNQAIHEIRRVHPHLPLIATLADADLEAVLSAFRSGANDVLIQPIDAQALDGLWQRISSQVTEEMSQQRVRQVAKRSLDDLVLLKAVGETARRAEDLQVLLDCIVDLIQASLAVDNVSLMLTDDDGVLRIRAARGLPEIVRQTVLIRPGEGIAGHVYASGEPVLIGDLSADGRFAPHDGSARYRSGSLLSVPISYQQNILGVLNVNNKRSGEAFDASDQDLLLSIAHQTALAVENLKLVRRLQENNLELERTHADLVRLHNDRTRFVCNLSHELKTPLTSVLGFADLLHNFFDQVEPDSVQEYIARIYAEGQQLERLLTGMLRLFSIDSGSENWQWQHLHLEEAVDRIVRDYQAEIRTKGLHLQLRLAPDLLPIWGDQDKLNLLLDALIDNAVKFNREGGLLLIEANDLTLYGHTQVCLRIANQGQSVPREHAEDIFEEYSQLGDLDAGKPRGVGIGLATCRAILHQMNGEIFLEPNEGREGTSFALLLPTGPTETEPNDV